jgi:hypothetical protein
MASCSSFTDEFQKNFRYTLYQKKDAAPFNFSRAGDYLKFAPNFAQLIPMARASSRVSKHFVDRTQCRFEFLFHDKTFRDRANALAPMAQPR